MQRLLIVGLSLCAALAAGIGVWSQARTGSETRQRAVAGPTRPAFTAERPAPNAPLEPPHLPANLALKQIYTLNTNAFVPPQCYTKTVDASGRAHNPCYACHVESHAPNYINDGDVQLEYAFVPRARKNQWKNLFLDWTAQIAAISDEQILGYIGKSNYFDERGEIVLAKRLNPPPSEWDHKDDGKWQGFVPDARFVFDDHGFDRAPDKGYTGWRAFAYYPFPGTFWPTNGSMGDVLIRLPNALRERENGAFDREVYGVNLAIVEAWVTRRSVPLEPVDEAALGVDLDQDGHLGRAREVRFVAEPAEAPPLTFVGRARAEQAAGRLHLAVGLYPEGTEFLHSVRYIDPAAKGAALAARLKELRYAKKIEFWSYARLDKRAKVEAIAKADSPSELRTFGGDIEQGVHNGQGWTFQGFIEDKAGELRPQTFEETVYCVGCHGGVGATDDSIFAFSRKLGPTAFQRGFYHWSQRGLEGLADRPLATGGSEYVRYLELNGAGDEFRQNAEVMARFFAADGRLKPEAKARIARDVSVLLLPSRERALSLNKAYRALVETQSFRLGREIVIEGARNVHADVPPGEMTGIAEPQPSLYRTLTQASPNSGDSPRRN